MIKDIKRIILLKTAIKTSFKSYMSVYVMQRPFSVHELPPLVFKTFLTTMHNSVMTQIILTSRNIFQILNT